MDDLTKVSGIGQSKLDAIKGLVIVGTASAAASKLAPGEKVNINTATVEQLDAHYIPPRSFLSAPMPFSRDWLFIENLGINTPGHIPRQERSGSE